MCGIVGYAGDKQAAPILLEGLSRLEYRGYDSAGLAVRDGDGKIRVVKAKGRLKSWRKKRITAGRCRAAPGSGTRGGRLTERPPRSTRTRTAAKRGCPTRPA